MLDLEINLDKALIDGVKNLARDHYDRVDDSSVGLVIEAALEMRLLAEKLAGQAGKEVEEPVTQWQSSTQGIEPASTRFRDWLFERRDDYG